jgi:hypothetical protein
LTTYPAEICSVAGKSGHHGQTELPETGTRLNR